VHALRHVHELLVPDGTVVDIHPVTESYVVAGGRRIGVIEEPEWFGVDLPNTEACLRQAIVEGYYSLEAEIEFDVLQHFDSVEELVMAKSKYIEVAADLVEQIRSAGPPIVSSEHYVGRRLRVGPAAT
jgi:hypothetical protein